MQCDRFCQPLHRLTSQFHHWLGFPDVSIQQQQQQQQQLAAKITTAARSSLTNYNYYQPSVSNVITIPVITAVNGTDAAAATVAAGVDDGAATCMVVQSSAHDAQRSAFHTQRSVVDDTKLAQ